MDIGCHFPLGVSGGFGIPSSPADFNWDGVVDALDLELMEMCMGAITDPNIVRLDLNYDSRVNMPDYGVFAFDYGYSADPNESFNNDPNCTRSDFDGDGRVDLADMATLAEHWLTVVTDEYRLCSLCNLHTAADPNDPNAPSGAEVIDYRDRDAFMAEWGKLYASDPNIVIEQTPSMVSVSVENPEPAWKISAFLDHDLIGQWEAGGLGSTAFDADLTRYGPGAHKVTIVRCIEYGQEISEYIVSDPNSVGLYFADIPDAFEPNEPYFVRGFNLGDELNFKIKDIYDTPIYDVNVPAGAVTLEIPSETFDEAFMTTFSASSALAPADEERYEKLLKRKFDPNSVAGKWVRVLVLLPDKKVTNVFKDAIFACMQTVEKRGVSGVLLADYDVNKENIEFLLQRTTDRKIVVFFGHANSHVGNIQRTQLQCYHSDKEQFQNVGAISYTQQSRSPAQSPKLPPYEWRINGQQMWPDDEALDITNLCKQRQSGFMPVDQMYVFGCLSAAFHDMAEAQGCGGPHDNSAHDMLYVGFSEKVFAAKGVGWAKGVGDKLVTGITIFFQQLGEGKKVEQAVQYLQSGHADKGIQEQVFLKAGLHFYGLGYGNVRFGYYGAQQ